MLLTEIIKTSITKAMPRLALLSLLSAFSSGVYAQSISYPFHDSSLSFHERAKNLVSLLTLDEKINQVGHQTVAITRLGVKGYYYWNEALHGVARSGLATSFPESKAMSSTWDTQLIYDCATATSDEARAYNNTKDKGLTYWCPTVNMSRDPRWGRDEENYGEDPYLTSRLAVAYIKGMQGNDAKYYKTIATVKHFAANNYEKGRHNTSSEIDARNMREYYLPAFEAAVKEANVRSVMSAYNAVNGVPCGANHELLIDILRGEWGFTGFVTSDCGAVDDVWNKHHYVSTATEASGISMRNGEDLNCGSTFQDYCKEAIERGHLTEAELDTALVRVFEARFSVGEFDDDTVVHWRNLGSSTIDSEQNRLLALHAAQESIVLLKNNSILPLDKKQSVAIIGPLGDAMSLGGYSGTPNATVISTPLDGIANKTGFSVNDGKIQCEDFTSSNPSSGNKRLTKETNGSAGNVGYIYAGDWIAFNDIDLGDGKSRIDILSAAKNSNATTVSLYLDDINGEAEATVTLNATGNWSTYALTTANIDSALFKGIHTLYLKFGGGDRYCANMDWIKFYNENDPEPLETQGPIYYYKGCSVTGTNETNTKRAAEIARKADVVVFAAGTDLSVSDESNDRKDISLPGDQQKVLEAVYAANPNVVLLLQTCSSVDVSWAQEHVPAIVEAWYGGQAQGQAIADVLYGDYNPSGKLTSTWYASQADLPSSMLEYDIRKNHYTYMYYNNTPLYPFGYGLSYTSYDYANLKLDKKDLAEGDSVIITFDVTNSGNHDGSEIVQLYTHAISNIERPLKELKGFARVDLAKGETKTVRLALRHDQLSYFNETTNTFDVEQGSVDVLIGASSADIRLKDKINTTGATVKTTYKTIPAGVASTEADAHKKNNKTYSLNGICIGQLDDTKPLPHGLYIIDNKKVSK